MTKISNKIDRLDLYVYLATIDMSKPKDVIIKDWEPEKNTRTLAQNRLSHMWYDQIGKQTGNGKNYDRNYFKFTYGCDVLMAGTDQAAVDFSAFYTAMIDKLDYEQCIAAMEFVSVTRLMSTKELALYLSEIEKFAAEHDFELAHPQDLYEQAMYDRAMGKQQQEEEVA